MPYSPSHAGYDSRRFAAAPARVDRDQAVLVYLLYALGFATLVTAPVGVLLAYAGRRRLSHGGFGRGDLALSHFDWQIRIFRHCLLAWLLIGLLHLCVAGLAALTFGVGAVLMVVPWALGLAWLLWCVWAIGRGLVLLCRGLAV